MVRLQKHGCGAPLAAPERPDRRLLALVVTLLGIVVLPSCAPVVRPPLAPLRSTLQLATLTASAAAPTGPTEVVFSTPTGLAPRGAEVSVVFDGPVRPLGLDSNEPAIGATLTPSVPGQWEWVGTSALRFAAAAPLPKATRFVVTVPADTPALPGRAMAQPHQFSFETPRPVLLFSEPEAKARNVPLDAVIELEFDQPIDPTVAAQSITLRVVGAEKPLPFTASRGAENRPTSLVLQPAVALPEEQQIVVEIAKTLRGAAGPLPTAKAHRLTFETAGPLRVIEALCTPVAEGAPRCLVSGPVRLRLTHSVDSDQLKQAISITPPIEVRLWEEYSSQAAGASYAIHGAFEPTKTYRLQVSRTVNGSPVTDRDGRPLVAAHQQTFRFGDLAPSLRFGGRGTYWPVKRAQSIPIGGTNVTGIELSGARLDAGAVMARLADKDDQRVPATVSFRAAQRLTDPPRNRPTRAAFKVADVFGAGARGAVLLRAQYHVPATAHRPAKTHVRVQELQLTNLGLFATVSAKAVQLWVTELSSGKPVRSATVGLRRVGDPNTIHAQGTTDSDGLVRLTLPDALSDRLGHGDDLPRWVAFVRTTNDWAYQELEAVARRRARGVVFTERGLYRPGETVHLKGIVRRPEAGRLVTPQGERLTVVVRDYDGQEVRRFQPGLSRFGTWHRSLRLSDAAKLGRYVVEVSDDDRITGTRFTVAAYEPVDFTIETSPQRTSYVRGDTILCQTSGQYLHGGPMARAKVRVELTRSEAYRDPASMVGYHTQDRTLPEPPTGAGLTRGAFDDRGQHRFAAKLVLPAMRGPERISCNAYGSDLDARSLSASNSALVHAGDIYLGLKNIARQVAPGERFSTPLRAVDLAGRPVALPVAVELIRRVVDPKKSASSDEVLERCQVTMKGGRASCSFLAPEDSYRWGRRFLIVRARATDRRGNRIGASFELVPEAAKPKPKIDSKPEPTPDDLRTFELQTPQSTRRVGQMLSVSVRSPWMVPATALVMVARDVVLWQQRIALPPQGAGLRIPITELMVPGAELAAVTINGERSQLADGYFEVSAAHRRLDVELEPSTSQALPGQEIEIAVRVKDQQGKPVRAEVTLFGADEATLWVASYQLPDPFWALLQSQWSSVRATDGRKSLFHPITWGRSHRSRPPRVRMGATNVGSGDIRGDFRQTVMFEPELVTDARGWVRQRVKLPDGLTTYRFMAVAMGEDDRSGATEATVTTSKPLMVRAKLPAVIRAGDRFKLAAIVSFSPGPSTGGTREGASTPRSKSVLVGVRLKGLELRGADQQRITLEPDVPGRVEFDVAAKTAGSFQIVVGASTTGAGKPIADIVKRSGEVHTPTLIEAASLYGDATGPVAESLGDLSSLRRDVGDLTITLAKTRLAGLDRNVEQLLEYPYGCTEQTASRMLPLLSLRDLSAEVAAKGPPDTEAVLDRAVRRLHSHQQQDGGFGAWPGSRMSDPWLSAYALWALGQARQGGVTVPSTMLDQGTKYLQAYLTKISAAPAADAPQQSATEHEGTTTAELVAPTEQQLTTAAFVVDVLAGLGHPASQQADRLFAFRDRLPTFAKAWLLHALGTDPQGDPTAQETLERDLTSAVRLAGNAAYALRPDEATAPWQRAVLASDTRSTALLLRALVAASPNHPLVGKLVTGLLAQLRQPRDATTQENAWALIALDAYRRAHPSPAQRFAARVFLNDDLLEETRFEPGGPLQTTVKIPVSKLGGAKGGKLTFDVGGKGRIHYQARLRFARRKLPTKPRQAGIAVHRAMRRVVQYAGAEAPIGLPTQRFTAGDLVRVDINVVTTAPRHFVVIDDPLPGGLVAIDPTLRSGLHELGEGSQGYDHRELRDDRVLFFVDRLSAGIHTYSYWARARTPGSYVLPPTQVHEMYTPEIRGITGVTRVNVARR